MLIPDLFETYPRCIPKRGVCHVGSHKGQERHIYNSVGVTDDNILWIDANDEYAEWFDEKTQHFIASAISDKDNESVTFHVTNNGESSSILPMKLHLIEHPHVHEVSQKRVTTVTLDTLFKRHAIPFDKFDFMNLDIQGVELRALKGAINILAHLESIYVEVNEKELYEGCGLVSEIDEFLSGHGFKRVATTMTRYGWGDALYLRESGLKDKEL